MPDKIDSTQDVARDVSIENVKVRTVRVPMPPHRTASGVVAESPLVLTDITTSEGIIGRSIIFTYTPLALQATAKLVNKFGSLIKDKPLAPAALEQTLAAKFKLLGTQGMVGMALAALDMALWDAYARVLQLPLARALGGIEKPIPAYAGIGYDGETDTAKAAEDFVKRGFKGVKAKIGYPTVAEDKRVIRAMRSAVGDDVAIMVDYNQSLKPMEAVTRLRELEQEGLTWVEEPTMAHDYKSHAMIAAQIKTPIQCGENWWGVTDMQHALDAKACDYMMPDVMKIGGVTGWVKAAALAQPNGVMLSSHLWPEVSAQLLSVTPTAHWLEYADWWNPVLQQPIEIRDGMAIASNQPGSGIEWNEENISSGFADVKI
ncbi:MAG: enolase C-terminal domain-like protein [Arenicellales bacterium WSBS_2016_MAG_OTU3]